MLKAYLNFSLLAIMALFPLHALGNPPLQIEIDRRQEKILLSWTASLPTDYQLLEFSDQLETWNTHQILQSATSTVHALRPLERERGFFRIKTVNRDALLGTFRHTWLFEPHNFQSAFTKQPLDLPDWEALMQTHQTEGGLPAWITKQVLGPSSVGNFEVVRYDFQPANPTKTVIITGSMHGVEWPSTDILLRMFQAIAEQSEDNPALRYLRNEVHFIVIPILNPWGYAHYERRCRETEPIPVLWERSGNTAIIQIDEQNFPNTQGRFDPEGYILTNTTGKLVVSLQSSSDPSTLPSKGYKIETVLDALRFTVECNNQGDRSGTAEFFVLTDMNRQFDINNWQQFSHLTWTDSNGVPYANKGTRPYALLETQYLRDILHTYSNAVAYLDFHYGPPAPYSAYYGANDNFDREPIDVILGFLTPPTNEISIGSNVLPSGNAYASQVLGMQSFTPEAGGSDATKIFRWWINILSGYSLLF